MFTKLMYTVGSLGIGANASANGDWVVVFAAACFLIGTLATFTEYEDEKQTTPPQTEG